MAKIVIDGHGKPTEAYVAVPDRAGPALIVMQEWWGLDDHIKAVCARFAADGFVALAPNLYHAEPTIHLDEARHRMMALRMSDAERDVQAAIGYLSARPDLDGRIGIVGFCLGGGLAMWAASLNPVLRAIASFYYVLPHGKPDFRAIKGTVLGHFGTADEVVPIEAARALEAEIRDDGVDATFHYYEGAGHAFFNDTNRLGTYDHAAAALAWGRTIDFFRRTLKPNDGGQ